MTMHCEMARLARIAFADHRAGTLMEQIPIPSTPSQFAHHSVGGPFRLLSRFRFEMVESSLLEVPLETVAEITAFSAHRGWLAPSLKLALQEVESLSELGGGHHSLNCGLCGGVS